MAHTVHLRILNDGVHARFLRKKDGAEFGDEVRSYTVIVNFDADSGTLSAWLAPREERIDHPGAGGVSPSGLSTLSARETEVLQRLALGDPDKEIARRMAISTGTVKVHVKAIIRKLGVSNRTQAAIQALELRAPITKRVRTSTEIECGDGAPLGTIHGKDSDNLQ